MNVPQNTTAVVPIWEQFVVVSTTTSGIKVQQCCSKM